jgi:hypothetical protein
MTLKLNLVLHGLFAGIVRDKNTIELWVPSFEDHKYEWQEWKRPPLAMTGGGHRHDLSGITGDDASLQALQPLVNTVLQGCPINDIPRHCTINLPFPERIWSLRKVCKRGIPGIPPFYTGEAVKCMRPAPEEIAMVHVFEYTISNLGGLKYEGRSISAPQGTQGRVRLHIWADPWYGSHSGDHRQPTPVEKTITAITGLAVQQEPRYLQRLGALDPQESLPPEMEFAELYNRMEREQTPPPQTSACDSDGPMFMRLVTCAPQFYHGL